ncbi:MAG: hypothetical protein JWM80_2541 [Cyanobacteria bacterium RYN_339]|nr:hypothetical protein [Cyanobacteria bacterium RYN_339]
MLDEDLARLYGVKTQRLNEQVKRNAGRFPADFMFQLTTDEYRDLMSQSATSRSWGGRRKLPNAFTEHGAVMLASVLNTPVAVEASVQVVRAFVRMRRLLVSQDELTRRLATVEDRVGVHDRELEAVLDAIRLLLDYPAPSKRTIGFKRPDEPHGFADHD